MEAHHVQAAWQRRISERVRGAGGRQYHNRADGSARCAGCTGAYRHTRQLSRNDESYAEGDGSDCWYKVISGTVRVCKLLADGRRHIAEFCLSGDCFGIDSTSERSYSAEAVDNVILMRYRRKATEQLIDQNPALARHLRNTMLRDLASAHGRTLL